MDAQRLKQDPLLAACALVPIVGLLTLYSFAVRARLALGEWPLPYRPDPKDLGFAIHQGAVAVSLEAALLSPVAFGVCLLLHQVASLRNRSMALSVAVYLAGYAALWALLAADPGSVFEWYAD